MVIKRIKGDTYPLDMQVLRDDETAIDITGCTLFFTVKRNFEDTDSQALIEKTITTFTSPSTGEFTVPLLEADVDYIGEFNYDLKIKYSTGIIESVVSDKIIFQNHVTIRTS